MAVGRGVGGRGVAVAGRTGVKVGSGVALGGIGCWDGAAMNARSSSPATAKWRPSAPNTPKSTIPTTRPCPSTSGPPEFPSLSAALVWTYQMPCTWRRAEKIPLVTVTSAMPICSGWG